MPLLTEARMRRLVSETLLAAGLKEDEAAVCADASVFADLRGAATHGIAYIVPRTLESLRAGKTRPGAAAQTVRSSGPAALLKGNGAAGPLFARQAMSLAIEKAEEHGIGVVNTFNGNPIGLLGYYANMAAEQGVLGLVMANTAPAAAPFGATSAVLGTNPFAYAAPSKTSRPILFDIATTVASSGKLSQAKRRGTSIPGDWLIDAEGKPVTDPNASKDAVMLPCGGHKGSGLSILIHLLTGGLSLTTVGGEPTHNHPDPERRGQAALFMAIDPGFFGSREGFEEMVERQIDFVHAARPLPGHSAPLYPGERGWSELERRRAKGILVPEEDWRLVVKAIADTQLPTEQLIGDIGLAA